jgi:acetyl-CoA acetyltransferase
MAAAAALKAIEQAKISPKDINLILVATATPDMLFPATACFVQKKIGAINAACLDISAACAGFLFGLEIAQQFITSHTYDTVLVIGAEKLTSITNLDRPQHLRAFRRWRRRGYFKASGQRSRRNQHAHWQRWPVHRYFIYAGRRFALPDHAR